MSIQTAYSTQRDVASAVAELQLALGGNQPRLVLYFASSAYDPAAMAAAVQQAFPGAVTVGCTTAGELVSGHMLKKAVVAMAFDAVTAGDLQVAVVENLKAGIQLDPALAGFEAHFGEPVAAMDYQKYVGFVLIDGLSGAEEALMDKLGDRTNVIFVGGSAGDDLHFESTHVFANGQSYGDAAVLVLLKPGVPFDFIKTQSFEVLPQTLVVSKADEATRTVLEFNGQPAVRAYAAALGKPVEEAAKAFMTHPVGLLADDQPFVRSPQKLDGEAMVFYCNVLEGMELSVLKSGDIVSDTAAALKAKGAEMNGLSGVINFHCILRTLELEAQGQTASYGEVFKDVPTVGFSTYGEAYLGHINQTSTMVVFH